MVRVEVVALRASGRACCGLVDPAGARPGAAGSARCSWPTGSAGRSYAPSPALAHHAETLGEGRQSEPVPVEGPAEVQALGTALQRLVDRIEVLLERERRGVSDLSHRLRTPVTALRLRAERLSDRDEAARIQGDLDELEGMVDHLVDQARRSEREGLVARADAVAVVGERVRFWLALAEDQGRDVELDLADGSLPVGASEGDLSALVDALLDNVFSHTAEGEPVRVELGPAPGGGALLVVEDGGEGYPDNLDVADRGVSGGGSSGLGMSIVATTAVTSGGSLVARDLPMGRGPDRGPPRAACLSRSERFASP